MAKFKMRDEKDTNFKAQRIKKKHIHRYARRPIHYRREQIQVWTCTDPLCTHYLPPTNEALILGRMSLCTSCDELFIMDATKIVMPEPICDACVEKLKPKPETFDLDDFITWQKEQEKK